MRNYKLEQRIIELMESYREKLPSSSRGWLAVAASVDLSRNAVYDIIDSSKEVRRDTVVLLGLALEMSLTDFNTLFNYKGFILRSGITRDEIIYELFDKEIYDPEVWIERLIKSGEETPFIYKKPRR